MITISYLYAKIFKKLRGKAIRNSKLHKSAIIYSGCQITNTQIGRYSYCGYDCQISNTVIGSFCSIAGHVLIGGAEHPLDWVSTSPVFENVKNSGPSKRFSRFDVPACKKTYIGHDVWIGHNVTIKQGVTIGNGAVIGAGSVVTKDVPAYAIVGGCPSKLIKYRFTPEVICELQDLEWWNLSDQEISSIAPYVKQPTLFIKFLKGIQ